MPETENGRGDSRNVGKIVEIKGVVIDAVFPETLPEILSALEIEVPAADGREAATLVAEVQQHLGDDRVRAVAMDSTDGLSRGVDVVDTGGPISVPVGDVTKGHVFNALGEVLNADPASLQVETRWPIHRRPPASSAGRSIAIRRPSATSRRRRRSSRPASRSSTCSRRSCAAARSASSAAPASVRRS